MLPLGATLGAAVLAWGFNAHPTQSTHSRALTVGHAHVNSGGAGGAGLESGEPLICDPGGKGLLLPLFAHGVQDHLCLSHHVFLSAPQFFLRIFTPRALVSAARLAESAAWHNQH